MNVYIILQCNSGLGDIYSSLISAYKIKQDFEIYGYSTHIVWMMNNIYFPPSITLDCIFNLDRFDKIHYFPYKYFHDAPSQINEHLIEVKQNQNIIKLFVDQVVGNILEYEVDILSHDSLIKNSYRKEIYQKLFDEKIEFLTDDILEKKNEYLRDKTNILGAHIRIQDIFWEEDYNSLKEKNELYSHYFKVLEEYIQTNDNQEILITSNNMNVIYYLENRYDNVFNKNPNRNTRNCHLYPNLNVSDDEYIQITKNIVTEMCCFKECRKILRINSYPSSFLTYGIIHNTHHLDYESKIYKLLI